MLTAVIAVMWYRQCGKCGYKQSVAISHLTDMSMSMSIAIFSVAQIVELLQSPRKRVL